MPSVKECWLSFLKMLMSCKQLQEIKLFLWNDFSGLFRIHYNRVTIHREDDGILSCGIDIRKMVISLQN
jgi:hypothetical protein